MRFSSYYAPTKNGQSLITKSANFKDYAPNIIFANINLATLVLTNILHTKDFSLTAGQRFNL